MRAYSIGQTSAATGLSADTLRYYERIGLLGPVRRDAADRRRYCSSDIERLAFIRRAKQMNFSLAEVATLLRLRDEPQHARPQVQPLAVAKLGEITGRIEQLSLLRDELTLLLNLCSHSKAGCPILDSLAKESVESDGRRSASL